jgi:hypothetical protein
MTKLKLTALICLSVVAVPSAVQASESDKKTIFTFNAPVEVPGKVLTPGLYVFKLLDSAADRHIVQIFDKDQTHLIGTFLTIPDYRMTPPDKPLITFEERAAGAPEAIKSWFYPGDNYGNEFVYPKTRAVQLAQQSHQNVPSMPSSMESNITSASQEQNSQKVNEMKQTPIMAEKPSGEEAKVGEVFVIVAPATPPPPSPEPQRVLVALVKDEPAPTTTSRTSAKELPKTASSLPLLELMGLLSLAAGLLLRTRVRCAR